MNDAESTERSVGWKLRRLDADGFRGLDSFSLSFSAVTCVIGPPSSGKSAVADAIRMLFHPGRGAGALKLSEWDFSRSRSNGDEVTFDLKALLAPLDDVGTDAPAELIDLVEYFTPDSFVPASGPEDDSVTGLRVGLQATWIPSEGSFSFEHYSPKYLEEDAPRRISSTLRQWLGVNVISSARSFWQELAPHSRSSLYRLLAAAKADLPAAAQEVAERLGAVGASLSEKEGFTEALSSLDVRIARTVGASQLDLRLGAGVSSRAAALARLSLVTGEGSPLELEGSGIAAAAVMASLLEVGGLKIIVVDAPEAALSAPLQRGLVSRLMNEADQTIVITHSPAIVSLFDPQEIAILRPSRGPLMLKDQLDAMSSQGQMLRFWRSRPDFMASLTGNWALVVEGPSDLMVYGRVLEHLARTEKSASVLLGVWMLDGGGTDAVHLLRFLEGCGVKTCAILDGDKRGAELKAFHKAATAVVQLPDGEDLEDLLMQCTSDPTLRDRIKALRNQKGNTLEHVAVTGEILQIGDPKPFVSLFRKAAKAIQSSVTNSHDPQA